MRRCLLISLLALWWAGALAQAADYLLPLGGRSQWAVMIAARGAEVTGICIVKTDDDGSSRGAIVNEFGVHALDFTLSADRRKVRLLNVMPQMDRWYVKRVVRADLRSLFNARPGESPRGRRTVTVAEDGTVTLTNERFKLRYSLKALDNETAE